MEEGLKDVPRKTQDDLETNASNISKNISSNNNLMKEHVSKKREKCEESYFSSDSGINIFNISYFKTIYVHIYYKFIIFMLNCFAESHTDEESSSQFETAISLAKQEIGVNNIDPVIAQKRALLVCKMEQLQNELSKTKVNSNT